jgi:hypothetical protein
MGIMGISQGQDTINHVEVNDTAVPTASSMSSAYTWQGSGFNRSDKISNLV